MKRVFTLSLIVCISQVVFPQVIPCYCECAGRLDLVSGNGFYLLDSITTYTWDTEAGDWYLINTSTFSYDQYFRKNGNTGYRFDRNTGIRLPSFKIDYLYGDHGEKTGYINYRWDSGRNRWEVSQRIELSYDKELKLTGQIVLKPDADGINWHTGYRSTYTYKDQGFDEIFEKEKWDASSNTWEKVFRTNYIKEGLSTTAISYHWKSGTWVPVSRTISINNNRGVPTETYNEQWDPDRHDWQTLSNATYLFDAKGNKTEWISTGQDKASGKPVIRGHQLYHYDNEGKVSEVLGISEDPAKGTVKNNSRKVYHWSLHSVSGLKGELSGEIKIFPNPFKYYTTVELSAPAKRVDILDTQGRVVRTYADITGPTLRIDRKELLPAIYFLKVYGDRVYTARMVIF